MGLDNGKFYNPEMSENNATHTFSSFFYVDYIIFHVKKNEKVRLALFSDISV